MRTEHLDTKNVYYSRNPVVGERRRGGEMVLVDSETDAIIHLNEMGQIIWGCVQKPVAKSHIIDRCVGMFADVPYEILKRDVGKLLDQLVERRILLKVAENNNLSNDHE